MEEKIDIHKVSQTKSRTWCRKKFKDLARIRVNPTIQRKLCKHTSFNETLTVGNGTQLKIRRKGVARSSPCMGIVKNIWKLSEDYHALKVEASIISIFATDKTLSWSDCNEVQCFIKTDDEMIAIENISENIYKLKTVDKSLPTWNPQYFQLKHDCFIHVGHATLKTMNEKKLI